MRRNDRAPAVIRLAKLFDADGLDDVAPGARRSRSCPQNTSSPARLRTTSDSPVSCDSSTSTSPVDEPPVEDDLVARHRRRRGRRARAPPGRTSIVAPSRTTVAVGRVSSAIRSSVRLARISWTMPTTTLVAMTASETRASNGRPTTTSAMPEREQDVVDEREDVLADDLARRSASWAAAACCRGRRLGGGRPRRRRGPPRGSAAGRAGRGSRPRWPPVRSRARAYDAARPAIARSRRRYSRLRAAPPGAWQIGRW